jgi:integrase
VVIKSLGTTDIRLANAKAEALKTDLRRQIKGVRDAAGSAGLNAFLQSLYETEVARAQANVTLQERLRLKAASRRATAADRAGLKNPEWELGRLTSYGAALSSDDPDERRAVAGWAADGYFSAQGANPPKDSPEYRAVLDQCADALVETSIAQTAILQGKPVPPPTSAQIQAATSNGQKATPTTANPVPTANGLLPLSRYFEDVYVVQSSVPGGRPQGERNIAGKRHTVRLFCELIGDKSIGSITRVDFHDFLSKLARLPDARSLSGPLKSLPADQLIRQIAASSVQVRLLHPKTANKHSSNLSAIATFAEERREIAPAHVQGVKVRIEEDEAPGRPFTNVELNRIFAQPLFTGCAGEDVEAGLFKPGAVEIRDDRFWIPLVLLFTGARSSEVVGLLAKEVVLDHATPHFVIQPNEVRRLKNGHSKRLVPIHSKLIEFGFLAFVRARQKDTKDLRLFPMAVQMNYREGATGEIRPKALSNSLIMRQFNRTILTHADARTNRGSVKCFRNTFEQEALAKIDSDESRQRLTGRKVVSSGRIYTSNQPYDPDQRRDLLAKLKIDIEKIAYSSVDMAAIQPRR